VRQLLLALHIFGYVLWMGGGFATMLTGGLLRRLPRNELRLPLELQERFVRALVLPGAVLVVLSGLMLTLRLYGSATSVSGFPVWLMVMQGAGLLGAVIVLVVTVPTSARLGRLDPTGPHAALFDALRWRFHLAEMVTGMLAVLALIGGVMIR
jgi:hypothetical protein